MSLTNKVLYNIDQTLDTDITDEDRARARKNIGAYEDKTAAGGIPKADLSQEVRSSLSKADSSVQSITSYGQALTKSAAGAIDIPKATNSKWGVVQVENDLRDNLNSVPTSRLLSWAVYELSAALQPRATFWTVQEWQTQSAQPGDPSKIYYVGPKGTGNDQYDMYEWRTETNSYVLTDESTISLDGYWHGAPDIVGEDTVAPFITSIEKNADDTVKYRTCSATVGNHALPVYMDSGVITPADPHFMYPTVNVSTSYEEVKRLVDAGYRPILVPDSTSTGAHTRYILTGAKTTGYGPAFIFTALISDSGLTLHFTSEQIGTIICQNAEPTWVWNDEVLIPNIPEPNQNESDVGKVLTVGEYGELYWDEPAGGNNVEVKAGTDNLHVTSAVVNDQTIFTMSADYYHSSGNYAGTYTGPGTLIVDPITMNLESTNSAYGYREEYREALIGSNTTATWNMEWMDSWGGSNIPTNYDYRLVKFSCRGTIRDDMRVHIKFSIADSYNEFETKTLYADDLRKETYLAIPTGAGKIEWQLGSDSSPSGYADCGYNIYVYAHSDNTRYMKGELAWKDQTYHYVDEQIETREPRLPVHSYSEQNKILVVSGDNGELGWLPIDRTLKIKKTSSTTDNELYVAANNAYNAGYIPVIEVNNNYGSYDYYYLVSKNSSRFDFEKSTTTFSNPLKGTITRMSLYENVLETSAVNLQRALSTSVTEFTPNYTRQDTRYYQSSSSTVHNDLSINLTIPAGAVALVIAKSLVSFIKDTSLKPYKAYLHIGPINQSCSSAGYANLDSYGGGTGTTAAMECSRIYDNRGSDEALIVPLYTTVGGDDTTAGDEARRNMTGVIYYYSILSIAGL